MKKLFNLLPLLFLMFACSTEPQDINYGSENCHFCTMSITDDRFASELMLNTGKALKYCSIECMVRDFTRTPTFKIDEVDNFYVIDMTNPNVFVPVTDVTFLISPIIKSPMGEHLAAFKQKSEAQKMNENGKGKLYTWDELVTKLK